MKHNLLTLSNEVRRSWIEWITYPACAIVLRSSSSKILTASSTPACPSYCGYVLIRPSQKFYLYPLTARPHKGILPRKQMSAPKANARNTSAPRRIPLSKPILMRSFANGAHSAKTSMAAATPSSCLPPWLEMTRPSRP